MRLAVTIDTEADGQWDYGAPLTTRNVAFWAPFQELCERHGVTPTYLVTSEIVDDERAREQLASWLSRGAAEVGAHLHPWTTPPFADVPGLRHNDPVHAFPSQLPDELLADKLETLTVEVAAGFGRRPTSYRAGRFGFDGRSAAIWPTPAIWSTPPSRRSGRGRATRGSEGAAGLTSGTSRWRPSV